ncbi:MAG TPA: 50S ribosomal protein L6 [Elusimicrobia bacterium]|nr:MAG: 50S ribosomal protein L6 [Elusimicrobia bacterium RIFOXYA12_FULL_49_49]OGS06139.1 MAG: 50S ribosomal protein L6 [Elusimicrobia bacterium RIFOXYA1_FULL_47_7]OGS09422.1 MAG: 50S ribosomal protein L6 [Elusimicrobia bacterium RIFOXYB1_FULL_48_9]OGS14602.1 MAG: 50S ribosomal protein L6 [Elusimicrobia bacterium RIFOXYA2_FULL_47_53]OGS25745.1 MAG: 50S ribosomal protein L6 [Elusimicrobia bacterium RIFOXYB12_FULL_50_12]OGS31693.1 MAG: 50S ribosomal protein L6 [Elusimicrobia bacterium RIFOXYB2_F
MSRLGKKPLPIPEKVKAEFKNQKLELTGPAGKLSLDVNPRLDIKIESGNITIIAKENNKETDMVHGLARGVIKNGLEGVTKGFKKDLEIQGLGFKAALEGKNLTLQLGYSHSIVFQVPEGVKIVVDKQTMLSISGVDKMLVGETAARIRSMKKPEPYGGTGVRYVGEHIIRKAGKAAAGGAAGAVKK